MTTVYTNNKYSDLFFYLKIFIGVAAISVLIYGAVIDYRIFSAIAIVLMIISALISEKHYFKLTVDEDKMTIYDRYSKNRPLAINKLEAVVYKYSQKGRFRKRIIIVEDGAHEIAVDISKSKADEITAHLKRLNPAIEVEESTKFFD
ncbi:MAG: hypothetical protein KBS89_02305 [Bacteroidales bacterium]|nr:hypothetical protein [Candidatus Egerieousia equi]